MQCCRASPDLSANRSSVRRALNRCACFIKLDARPAGASLAYGHVWSGRFTTIGVEVLLTTTQ
jgi:hypothetical protein